MVLLVLGWLPALMLPAFASASPLHGADLSISLTASPESAVGGSNVTPTRRMSCVNAEPSASSATRPTKVTLPPSLAMIAAVLAAPPPDCSTDSVMAA